jgi:hypothetical protein
MSGIFDPASLLESTTEQVLDTKLAPIPEGEFVSMVDQVAINSWTSKKDPSLSGLRLDVTYTIEDDALKAQLDREKITIRQGILLDLTEDGKGIDYGKGKNINLGRLREACGLNTPGQPFAPLLMVGRPVKIRVTQRQGDNPEDIFNDVKGVTKAF